jgi:hypothetical protein
MVENLAESPGMCSDGPESARIKILKEGAFSLRESKKEREGKTSCGLGKRKEATDLSPRDLGPTSARHARTVRGAHADGLRGARTVCEVSGRSGTLARTVRYLLQNVQYCLSSPRAVRTVRAALADGPPGAAGQSGPLPRTVRPSFTFSA